MLKVLRTVATKDCTPGKKVLDFSRVTTETKEATVYFKGVLELMEDLPTGVRIQRKSFRCNDPVSRSQKYVSNCIQLGSDLDENLCYVVQAKAGLGSGTKFFNGFHPRLSCPIKKGLYNISNARGVLNAFVKLPVEGYPWKLIFKVTDKEKIIYCFEWIVKVFTQSSKKV